MTDKEVTKVEETKTPEGVISTHSEALKVGYFGVAMSPIPTVIHEAGNEQARAELYGASPVPEAVKTVDGPFASMEAARKSVMLSNDLATVATHPTLRGAVVNSADSEKAARKNSK